MDKPKLTPTCASKRFRFTDTLQVMSAGSNVAITNNRAGIGRGKYGNATQETMGFIFASLSI